MTRQTKTPKQRAEETLGIAQRRVDRLYDQVKDARDLLATLEYQLEQATARRDYAKKDPALTTPSTTTTPGGNPA